MKYFIGADLGTSALKLLLTDNNNRILKTVTREYKVYYPAPGWSEQNPQDWWTAFESGIIELLEDTDKSLVCGIAVAGQMHGLVILDGDDNIIRPAILWNDGRTHAETDYLNNVIGKKVLSDHTANIAFAGFTAPKILWVANNEKENFEKISKIMLPKDYINYKLTGVHATDYSDASGMLLLDVKNKCWSEKMIKICGVHKKQLPKLFESYQCIGNVLPQVAQKFGIPSSVKVAAGAGDNAAAAIGMAISGGGKCNISLGTSGTVFITGDKFGVDSNNALHSFCHADGGYHLMGCILSAASCNKWFCDNVLQKNDYATVHKEITDDMLGKNNVYFLPYLMGERSPINDTHATGMFIGLRPDTAAKDMLLAVLEGVAFAIKDNLEIAKGLGIDIVQSTVCGGGAKSALWLKIMANVLDIKLNVLQSQEGPGLGAAVLAAVADNSSLTVENASKVSIIDTVYPDKVLSEKYRAKYEKFKKIYPAVRELYKLL